MSVSENEVHPALRFFREALAAAAQAHAAGTLVGHQAAAGYDAGHPAHHQPAEVPDPRMAESLDTGSWCDRVS